MEQLVDLHCHSTASDGTLSPAEVVRLAQECGLSALALTDHDTIGGLAEAQREARKLGIDFIPGIEISAEYAAPGTLHILGYGVDAASSDLQDTTRMLIGGRDTRNPKIIAKLNELGVAITLEEAQQEAAGESGVLDPRKPLGRPHIAAVLVRKGYVSSIKLAFDRYLGHGAPAYFDKERLSPRKAIACIRDAGGLAVLAHPIQLRCADGRQLEQVVRGLVDLGLSGIEVIHSDHDAAWVDRCSALAEQFGLLKTGGSDFHGLNKKAIQLGLANGRRIPRVFFDTLKSSMASSNVRG